MLTEVFKLWGQCSIGPKLLFSQSTVRMSAPSCPPPDMKSGIEDAGSSVDSDGMALITVAHAVDILDRKGAGRHIWLVRGLWVVYWGAR